MHVQYSAGIIIRGWKKKGRNKSRLPQAKATEFMNETRGWLDQIKSKPTGGRMLAEIDGSGHTVEIFRTWDINEGNLQGGGGDGEFVVPLDKQWQEGIELHFLLSEACDDISGRSRIRKMLKIGKAKRKFLKRDALARLCGTTSRDLARMEAGKMAIPKIVDDKLRVYLYDFLEPGPGEDCYVVFNHRKENLSPQHKTYLPQSHNWQNRPPGIALAHELVHAWRVVSGRVLFDYGWEEEAMTVGLPPFGNMDFTENRIRTEWQNLAVRPDYRHIGVKSDLIAATEKIGMDKTGDRSWLGDQGALHPQQKLAQQMGARRAAMGYDDDDDWDDSDDGF